MTRRRTELPKGIKQLALGAEKRIGGATHVGSQHQVTGRSWGLPVEQGQ